MSVVGCVREGQKVGSEGKAGGTWVRVWVCVKGCWWYGGVLVQGSGARGVCQYRCSVTGCHNSGQEAESDD